MGVSGESCGALGAFTDFGEGPRGRLGGGVLEGSLCVLGASWGFLGASWGRLGGVVGPLGASWGLLGNLTNYLCSHFASRPAFFQGDWEECDCAK